MPRASVTSAVNEKVPARVGVPDTVPPVERARPSGSAPALSDQLYGDLPPVAPKVMSAYVMRTSPAWKAGGLATRAAYVGDALGDDRAVVGVLLGVAFGEVVTVLGVPVGVSPATGDASTVGDDPEDGLGALPSGTRPQAVTSNRNPTPLMAALFF